MDQFQDGCHLDNGSLIALCAKEFVEEDSQSRPEALSPATAEIIAEFAYQGNVRAEVQPKLLLSLGQLLQG